MTSSEIDAAMRLYRKQHPDAFERADVIARMICPEACSEWRASDKATQDRLDVKTKYMRAAAQCKACEILRVLGVNMDCDWNAVLTALVAQEATHEPRC